MAGPDEGSQHRFVDGINLMRIRRLHQESDLERSGLAVDADDKGAQRSAALEQPILNQLGRDLVDGHATERVFLTELALGGNTLASLQEPREYLATQMIGRLLSFRDGFKALCQRTLPQKGVLKPVT